MLKELQCDIYTKKTEGVKILYVFVGICHIPEPTYSLSQLKKRTRKLRIVSLQDLNFDHNISMHAIHLEMVDFEPLFGIPVTGYGNPHFSNHLQVSKYYSKSV